MRPFCGVVALAVLALSTQPLRADKESEIMEGAYDVMGALADIPLKGIPPTLMRDAQGVAIFPGVIKAGFVVGGRYGRGVFLLRENGDSWSRPMFLTITGGGIGWQIGVQSTDLVLIFKTRNSVERLLKGKSKLTLGADLAIAAGPVGRQAEAATDAALTAEIYSYSRSRGLFAGLSVEGAALQVDSRATEWYYREGIFGNMTGRVIPKSIPLTPPEEKLRMKLAVMCATPLSPVIAPPDWVPPVPAPLPPPSQPVLRQPN